MKTLLNKEKVIHLLDGVSPLKYTGEVINIKDLDNGLFMRKYKVKPSHKNLRIEEAGYIYYIRYNLSMDFDEFIDKVFLSEDLHYKEFDRICDDIRMRNSKYYPGTNGELSDSEWELILKKYSNDK